MKKQMYVKIKEVEQGEVCLIEKQLDQEHLYEETNVC